MKTIQESSLTGTQSVSVW